MFDSSGPLWEDAVGQATSAPGRPRNVALAGGGHLTGTSAFARGRTPETTDRPGERPAVPASAFGTTPKPRRKQPSASNISRPPAISLAMTS